MRKYESPVAKAVSFGVTDVIAASWDSLIVWGNLVYDVNGSEDPEDNTVVWE